MSYRTRLFLLWTPGAYWQHQMHSTAFFHSFTRYYQFADVSHRYTERIVLSILP